MGPLRVAVVHSARTRSAPLVAATLDALSDAGHEVVERSVTSGEAVDLDGQQAVVLLSPEHPSLRAHQSAWREWDRWHATTVPWLTSVARSAGARRLVLQSSALVYADGAAALVDERSALAVTPATEPWCAAETATHRFGDRSHLPVVLRLAPLVDDPAVAPWLESAAGRAGTCLQVRWQPRLTVAEAAAAFVSGLDCPAGIHTVGVSVSGATATRAASAASHRRWVPPVVGQVLPWRERTGERLEPYTRSLRLSSQKFERATGWHPARTGVASRG